MPGGEGEEWGDILVRQTGVMYVPASLSIRESNSGLE